MSTSLIQINLPPGEPPFALTPAQAKLRQMVLDSVQSIHSKLRNVIWARSRRSRSQ